MQQIENQFHAFTTSFLGAHPVFRFCCYYDGISADLHPPASWRKGDRHLRNPMVDPIVGEALRLQVYVMNDEDLSALTSAIVRIVQMIGQD